MSLEHKLDGLLSKHDELQNLLATQSGMGGQEYARLSKEFTELNEIVRVVKIYREVPDKNGKLAYTINIENFIQTGDRSDFIKIMPNDTFIIPQKTSSYIMGQIGALNTILSILNIYLQIDNRNN